MLEETFQSFDSMFSLFWVFFIIIAVLIVASFVLSFWRAMKSGKNIENQVLSQHSPPVTEREIIREVIKIRCPYCGTLYDENVNSCPNCGAKR
jgi:DNA-directed RNA polymerase subunit RPC12/RpoP